MTLPSDVYRRLDCFAEQEQTDVVGLLRRLARSSSSPGQVGAASGGAELTLGPAGHPRASRFAARYYRNLRDHLNR